MHGRVLIFYFMQVEKTCNVLDTSGKHLREWGEVSELILHSQIGRFVSTPTQSEIWAERSFFIFANTTLNWENTCANGETIRSYCSYDLAFKTTFLWVLLSIRSVNFI